MLYMGPSLTHLNDTVLNSPGDHTAGIMYMTWTHPNSPVPGFSGYTNYPFGESMRIPTTLSSQVLSFGHWFISYFSNIVTGWNMMVLIGYMSSALAMFGLVYWLTENQWAAFFSGYAIAFAPYHVFASRGQIAGLFGGIFILALWQFLSLWKKPRLFKAISLGSLLGISFYMDGYFILIGLVLLGVLWLASLVVYVSEKHKEEKDTIKKVLTSLLYTTIIAILFLAPLIWVNSVYAAKISSILGNARGSVELNAMTYSAKLPMYVNPKNLLFLGYSVIGLSLAACILRIKEKGSRAAWSQKADLNNYVYVVAFLLAFIAIWTSLQPVFHIGQFPFFNPSKLIISITPAWRVFGRLYTLVSIGLICLAGLGLNALITKFPKYKYMLIIGSFLWVMLELSIYPLLNKAGTFSYSNTPSIYRRLASDTSVRAIAEYPLNNAQYAAEYYTFQAVSSKPMLNSFLASSSSRALSQSIVGINDPQTIPVLRALGIDVVNIRPVLQSNSSIDIAKSARQNTQLESYFSKKQSKSNIESFLITRGEVAEFALTMPDESSMSALLKSNGGAIYTFSNDFNFSVLPLPNARSNSKEASISFTISADSFRSASLVQNGKIVWAGILSPKSQSIEANVSVNETLNIYIQKNQIPPTISIEKPLARPVN